MSICWCSFVAVIACALHSNRSISGTWIIKTVIHQPITVAGSGHLGPKRERKRAGHRHTDIQAEEGVVWNFRFISGRSVYRYPHKVFNILLRVGSSFSRIPRRFYKFPSIRCYIQNLINTEAIVPSHLATITIVVAYHYQWRASLKEIYFQAHKDVRIAEYYE